MDMLQIGALVLLGRLVDYCFLQACRGNEKDDGVEVADSESADDAADDSDTPKKRIPVAADFLIAYATAPGLFSTLIAIVVLPEDTCTVGRPFIRPFQKYIPDIFIFAQ